MLMDAWRATRVKTTDRTTEPQASKAIEAITGRATETSRAIEIDTITSRVTDPGTGTTVLPMADTRRLVRTFGPAATRSWPTAKRGTDIGGSRHCVISTSAGEQSRTITEG